jgi:DNA-binding MarR family transcriptional regulator
MRWRSVIDRDIAALGLTAAQYAALAPLLALERQGRRPSQRELADFTGLEPLYVSKLARALEQAGLVERTSHPADTRAVQVTLTRAGRAVAEQAVERVVALQTRLTAAIGGPDSPQARALRQTLELLLSDPPGPPGQATPDPPRTGAPS